jgi:hypothetical protein
MTARSTAPEGATARPWQIEWDPFVASSGIPISSRAGPHRVFPATAHGIADAELIVRAVNLHDELIAALNYVADMTCIDRNGDWGFKREYDPQIVLDALARVEGRQ